MNPNQFGFRFCLFRFCVTLWISKCVHRIENGFAKTMNGPITDDPMCITETQKKKI